LLDQNAVLFDFLRYLRNINAHDGVRFLKVGLALRLGDNNELLDALTADHDLSIIAGGDGGKGRAEVADGAHRPPIYRQDKIARPDSRLLGG
jgi:hypothetical protein